MIGALILRPTMLFLLLACADPVEPASYLSVLTINPSQGAINVPVDSDLRVIFSAEVQMPAVEQVSLSTAEGTPIPVALRWFEDTATVLVVDPTQDLAPNTEFVLSLGAGLSSEVGDLGAQVESSFSTGSAPQADADTDADSDSDSDSDADADSDTDSDADADTTFTPAAIGVSVTAALDGGNLVRWGDGSGSYQPSYVVVSFYEEAYLSTGDARYKCDWLGSTQVQDQANIDTEAYAALVVRLSDLGASDCGGFPQTWGPSREPSAILTSQDYGLAFTPMSDPFAAGFRDFVQTQGVDWGELVPFVFSTRFAALDGADPTWNEVSYAYALELDDDGVLQGEGQLVDLDQGIDGELIVAEPYLTLPPELFTD